MDAKIDGLRLNMAGLIQGSNEVNEKVCLPAARKIAARANASGAGAPYKVVSTPRGSSGGWARTRVVDDSPQAIRREAKRGTLARSMGG